MTDLKLFYDICIDVIKEFGGEVPNWNRVMGRMLGSYTYMLQDDDTLDEIEKMMRWCYEYAPLFISQLEWGEIGYIYWGEH